MVPLLRRFAPWVQVLGGLAGIVALFVLYTIVDEGLKRALEGVGPSWLHEEAGIFTTSVIVLVAGAVLARRTARDRRTPASPAFR